MSKEEFKEVELTSKEAKVVLKSYSEYSTLKSSENNVLSTYKILTDKGIISQCHPRAEQYYGNDCKLYTESLCYLLFEIMEGKHNDYLRGLIDREELI